MFKIGDEIIWKNSYKYFVGTVIAVDGIRVGVDFGEGFLGHDLNGRITTETGWYMNERVLKLNKKSNKGVY